MATWYLFLDCAPTPRNNGKLLLPSLLHLFFVCPSANMGAHMSSLASLPQADSPTLLPQRYAAPSTAGYILYWVRERCP